MLDWFSANARDLPWRRTREPYAIWVSEIMLQQTQVKTVMPFWERWLRELPTIESVANANSEKIHKLWEGLGYYSRARNLQKAAQQIVENCRRRGNESQIKIGNQKIKNAIENEKKLETPYVASYKFPENFDDVLALPGIGRYTAGAICSIAFNQPKPILDGNVIRVLTRIFGIEKNPREQVTNRLLWKIAEELVCRAKENRRGGRHREPVLKSQSHDIARENLRPTKNWNCSHLNQSLMELGALICTPRNPKCLVCPAKKLCIAFKENRIDELPNLGKREKSTARRFVAFVIERDGKFLVQQRPEKVVNAHLWEFPNFEINGENSSAPEIFKLHFSFAPKNFQPLCTIKHSITRYRMTLEAFRVFAGPPKTACEPRALPTSKLRALSDAKMCGKWFSLAELDSLAFTSAHRKILKQIGGVDLPA